jgi:hypothetical protein
MGNQDNGAIPPDYAMGKQRKTYHTEFMLIRKITFLCSCPEARVAQRKTHQIDWWVNNVPKETDFCCIAHYRFLSKSAVVFGT